MEDLEVQDGVVIPGHELWFTASRSGGPGGQHANKTSSAVTIHWSPENNGSLAEHHKRRVLRRLHRQLTQEGILQITVQDERSQHRNRAIARERLAETIRKALEVRKRRIATRPSKAAKRRRVDDKRHRSKVKEKRQNPTRDDW
ncbi:MAG: alternative ribosome rescue aminoacyl-tRNA hydrolase ArfB [Myxococcota bacterium]